jgi:1,4-alpha-glucan branching enzyme
MPASQQQIQPGTPLGANLVAGGATFRTWAPAALEVYVVLGTPGGEPSAWAKDPNALLVKDEDGFWGGFLPGVQDGNLYRFYVVGTGSEGFKRDPYARELEMRGDPWYPCNCIVRDANQYAWHDHGFRPPAIAGYRRSVVTS